MLYFPFRPVVALPGLLIMVLLNPACRKTAAPAAPPEKPAAVASVTEAPAPAVAAQPAMDPAKVQGSWVRQDGGYRLVIGTIGEAGHAHGEYYNPSPIKVAWTRVRAEGDAIKVDVELRDTNYPGCLYKLTYDAAADQLSGTYFQAQLQQTYNIVFVRQP